MSSVNCLVGSYAKKLNVAPAVAYENVVAEKLLTKQTERARHYEGIALERQWIIDEFKEQVSVLKDEKDQVVSNLSTVNARLDALAAEKEYLKEELKASEQKLTSEQWRLRNSRDNMVYDVRIKTLEEITAKYADPFENIRKYIDDRNQLEEVLLMLSQIKGTRASLRVLKEEGVPIPDDRLEKLTADEVEWHAKAKVLDVYDLETSVLNVTLPRSSFS